MSAETISYETIQERMRGAQKLIAEWAEKEGAGKPLIDEWSYHKGGGGGVTIVWEDPEKKTTESSSSDKKLHLLEKGGVNWSGIQGQDMPASAQTALNLPNGTSFRVSGVSLVMHPHSPLVPTIHLNVRYFEADASPDAWWFGGGIDLTPVYPNFELVKQFHAQLLQICARHGMDYGDFKRQCDEYFFLKHRNETRGIGGIFFDNLGPKLSLTDKAKLLDFVIDLASSFPALYGPFTANQSLPFTDAQREFQLWRRSRYVEFNLLFDRGTKFGIQSEGRTESILMSLPAVCTWRYSYTPEPGTPEAILLKYLKPHDWLSLDSEDQLT